MNLLFISSLISASIYNLLDEKKESESILKSLSLYFMKRKNYKALFIVKLLLDKKLRFVKKNSLTHCNIKLISLLKKADENKSYTYYKTAFELNVFRVIFIFLLLFSLSLSSLFCQPVDLFLFLKIS